jgi:peptidoglycan hydrolase CwlO-like protein
MLLSTYSKSIKFMQIQKLKINLASQVTRQTALFACIMLILGTAVSVPIVRAETLQQKINQLNSDNAQKSEQAKVLQVEANGIEATISSLQTQIDGLQARIFENQAKSIDLENLITAAQAQLDQQKKILGENIKAMYLEGDISTIEMLATSKDLSAYFDKQQYRDTVKTKIKSTLDSVTALKAQLKDQQESLKTLINQQFTLKGQVQAQRSEQDRLLNLNEGQRSSIDSQLRANYAQISELRRQQAAAIAALAGNSGSSATGSSIVYRNLVNGGACNGGYPSEWCNVPLDAWVYDNWGLSRARECVHYAAWAAEQRGATIPNLAGRGNAYQWAGAFSGVATIDNNPSGATVVYLPVATLGHVAIVEHDYGDGWVHVSQYNWMWPGNYSEMDLKVTSNLLFFHF